MVQFVKETVDLNAHYGVLWVNKVSVSFLPELGTFGIFEIFQ